MGKDAVKNYIISSKWIFEILLVWPDNDSRYITAVHWLFFLNMVLLEIFHASYVIVHRADVADAILTLATVTTTFEVSEIIYIKVEMLKINSFLDIPVILQGTSNQ